MRDEETSTGGASATRGAVRFTGVSAGERLSDDPVRRMLRLLSRCNRALVRSRDERSLLAEVCGLLTGCGGYRYAVIAQPSDGAIAPLAASGLGPRALMRLRVTSRRSAAQSEPVGTAVHTRRAVIVAGAPGALRRTVWRAAVTETGAGCLVALPIVAAAEGVWGALAIGCAQTTAPGEEELGALEELAADLSYGIRALRDASSRRQVQESLRLHRRALESIPNGIMITDARAAAHPIVHVNRGFERITGYAQAEVLGHGGRFLVEGLLGQAELEPIRHALRDRCEGDAVIRIRCKDGAVRWNHLAVAPVLDEQREVTHFISVFEDVDERVRAQQQLARQANHDGVTGLPNGALLLDRIAVAMAAAARSKQPMAVLSMDLDRFKSVNERLGHRCGDSVLRMLADRLTGAVRETDTVARSGGDEFVVVLASIGAAEDAMAMARKLQAVIAQPLQREAGEITVSAAVGVGVYPADGEDAEQLLKHADLARYRAKAEGRGGCMRYDKTMSAAASGAAALELELRRALERGEFVVHYQPQVGLRSNRIVGFEALVRWAHPTKGMVSPERFIPLAEETGLIVPIGEWVLATACAQARAWRAAGLEPGTMAVNVSARQLCGGKLVERVRAILAGTGLDPAALEIEVTESMLMENLDAAAGTLERLRALGVRIAMDDFGTGYSSLGYLKRLPVGRLKIDRSFIRNVTTDPDDANIALAVIAMAHSLRLEVLAEGVETQAQLRYLRAHGCDAIQGYYSGAPSSAPECEALLRSGRGLDEPTGSARATVRPCCSSMTNRECSMR